MTSAIILAGGLGTRLRSEVPDLPKPMAPIGGRPFLEWQMDYWIAQGVNHFVLSVGYRREVIMDYFGGHYSGVPVDYAVEETPLGTGGGLLIAAQFLDRQPALVLNGDTFFEVNLIELSTFHLAKGSRWTFSLFRANEAGRYMGMNIAANGRILALNSGTDEIGRLANGGIYLLHPDVLQESGFKPGDKVSLENDILNVLLHKGIPLYGREFAGRFIDIGVPEDYRRASEILLDA